MSQNSDIWSVVLVGSAVFLSAGCGGAGGGSGFSDGFGGGSGVGGFSVFSGSSSGGSGSGSGSGTGGSGVTSGGNPVVHNPEPASMALFGAGAAGMAISQRLKARKRISRS